MDIRKVKKLIELLDESGIAEIEITEGEEAVRISRYPQGMPVSAPAPVVTAASAPAPQAPVAPAPTPSAPPPIAAVPEAEEEVRLGEIVGTALGRSRALDRRWTGADRGPLAGRDR